MTFLVNAGPHQRILLTQSWTEAILVTVGIWERQERQRFFLNLKIFHKKNDSTALSDLNTTAPGSGRILQNKAPKGKDLGKNNATPSQFPPISRNSVTKPAHSKQFERGLRGQVRIYVHDAGKHLGCLNKGTGGDVGKVGGWDGWRSNRHNYLSG